MRRDPTSLYSGQTPKVVKKYSFATPNLAQRSPFGSTIFLTHSKYNIPSLKEISILLFKLIPPVVVYSHSVNTVKGFHSHHFLTPSFFKSTTAKFGNTTFRHTRSSVMITPGIVRCSFSGK